MFLIVPKRSTSATSAHGKELSNVVEPGPISSATVRTQNACDGCRLRKTKCDGKRPSCTKCRSRGLVCVFSRSGPKAIGPVTADHLAVLQHQRQRLVAAVRRMAMVIEELQAVGNGNAVRAPLPNVRQGSSSVHEEELDITELLDMYAPEVEASPPIDEPPESSLCAPKTKKRRLQTGGLAISTGPGIAVSAVSGVYGGEDLESSVSGDVLFLSLGADAAVGQEPTAPEETYAPFLRMLQTMNRPSVVPNGAVQHPLQHSEEPEQSLLNTTTALSKEPFPVNATTALPTPQPAPDMNWDPRMAPLLDMVDWDASLQSCWDFYDDNNVDPTLGLVSAESTSFDITPP